MLLYSIDYVAIRPKPGGMFIQATTRAKLHWIIDHRLGMQSPANYTPIGSSLLLLRALIYYGSSD